MSARGLHILLLSVHGMIRGKDPELGRDPDTGGQVLYVLELAKALSRRRGVGRVDILTRLIQDPELSEDYSRPVEVLAPKARILRVPFGPPGYLRKELLWEHLDGMADAYLAQLPKGGKPDILHSHYGDAGWVARRISRTLGLPFIHSAHSLGRYKKATMLAAGGDEAELDLAFNFPRRVEAEEAVLAEASLLIASTRQELEQQYAPYRNYNEWKSLILPPGTDTSRFHPPGRDQALERVAIAVDRFLQKPELPMLLSIGRAVPRKNLLGLVQAFGEDPTLRDQANLVLVAGHREDIRSLDGTTGQAWESILLAIDQYDLYGHVAIPKTHTSEDIPDYYRLAAARRGLFVNPSISETFGLTLIEAAASGLPVVATDQGGPQDILQICRNGLVADTRNPAALADAIRRALASPRQWNSWAKNGLRAVQEHFTWDAHAEAYLRIVRPLCNRPRETPRTSKDMAWSQ